MIMELTVIAAIACVISTGIIYITLQSLKREKALLESKSPVDGQRRRR